MNKIHNTAIIGKNTIVGSNVEIGPYCVIEDGVKIGNDNIIHSTVYMSGETDIGNGNNFEIRVEAQGETFLTHHRTNNQCKSSMHTEWVIEHQL